MHTPDQVGAFVIHALMVGNSKESLDLSWKLYQSVPSLLTQLHVNHRDGFPLFAGESALHIACVNDQEELLCLMLDLAQVALSAEDFETLLRSQAHGVFFDGMPMRFYGGTALAYACCFELRSAVLKMLSTKVVSLNERRDACCITGFLPLHAVASNGLKGMYEWMTKEIPDELLRADERQLTSVGRMTSLGLHCLTTLQLTALLGDHATFKHILQKQCSILWVWGPVTQYSINLLGVDSAGSGGGDVMELIGRIDAKRETTELLLDEFMQGFIHKLFVQKWNLFGWRIHYTRRAIDVLIFFALLAVAFALKDDLASQHSAWMHPTCWAMLVLMFVAIEEEGRNALLYWRNTAGLGGVVVKPRERLATTLRWCKSHAVHTMLISYSFTSAALLLVLTGSLEDPYAALEGAGASNVTLLDASSDYVYTEDMTTPVNAPNVAIMWTLLAFGLLIMCAYNATTLFMPYEHMSVFMLSFTKMFKNDLAIFLLLFGYFMTAFSAAMFILYPRSGEGIITTIPAFNTWYSALYAQLGVALVGNPTTLYTDPALLEPLGPWEMVDMMLFFVCYFFFVLISLILLLNLFIAMLSNTFEESTQEAILQSRTSFAQGILKLELLADSFGMPTKVGEAQGEGGDTRVFAFRSVKKNSEGGGTGGSADPFEVPDEGGAIARIEAKLEQLLANKESDDKDGEDEVLFSSAPRLPPITPTRV